MLGIRSGAGVHDSPSDDKTFTLSTQQLQFNPTKSSRLGFRRSKAAIAALARSRFASSRAVHEARDRADPCLPIYCQSFYYKSTKFEILHRFILPILNKYCIYIYIYISLVVKV